MSDIDACIDHWRRVNCSTDSSVWTSLADPCMSAIKCHDWEVHDLCYLQGTPKVLHSKPNIPVTSAWTTPASVRKKTPSKFSKARKTPPCIQNRNNCRTNDKDSVCVRKMEHRQGARSNLKDCKLSQCNSSTKERTDQATSRDNMFLDIELKKNCVVSNSDSAPKHTESPEIDTNQGIAIVELFPGVKSYILDMNSKVQSNENKPEDNEAKLEEQLFSTLKDCPDPADNSDDDTSMSWYRKTVQREFEEYLKKVSKGCDQGSDAARQSPSSRQSLQHSSSTKATDSDRVQDMTETRRIDRTARYVSYIMWKKNLGKSKVEKRKVWNLQNRPGWVT